MRVFFIIFSAGLGSRLNTSFPKPLSPLINSTILDYNINSIIKTIQPLEPIDFVIYVNLHKSADKIYKYLLENYYWLIKKEKLKFLFEHKPLGHIGTIDKLKYNILRYNKLITLNADSFIPSLEKIILPLIYDNFNYLILVNRKISKKENELAKTLTHFFVKPFINAYKIEGFTKNIEKREEINLYTGVSIINLTKEIQKIILEPNFKNLTYLDFLKILINFDLLAIFTKKFYEITTLRDLLEINSKILQKNTHFLDFYIY